MRPFGRHMAGRSENCRAFWHSHMARFFKKSGLPALLACWLLSVGASGQVPVFRAISVDTRSDDAGDLTVAAEDSTGMLWLAAWDGLWRYDGSNFDFYRNAQNEHGEPVSLARMAHILLSRQRPQWLWLGSNDDGLWGLDIATGRAEHLAHDPTRLNTPGGNRVTGLHEAVDGSVWFTTDNFTLNHFDGQNTRRFVPPFFAGGPATPTEGNILGGIAEDVRRPNWLWVGSRFGLYRFDTKAGLFEFFAFPRPFGLYYEGGPVPVFVAPDGIVWTGGRESGLLRFDPTSGQFQTILLKSPDGAVRTVNSIQAFGDGRLLIGSNPDPLWLHNPATGRSDFASPFKVEGSTSILLQHRKSSGQHPTWFVRTGPKLYRLTLAPQRFEFQYLSKRNPRIQSRNWQRAYCLAPDGKYLYMGTLNGLGVLQWDWQRDTIARILAPRRKPGTPELDIWYDDLAFDPDGQTLWVGTDRGLMRWQAGWEHLEPPETVLSESAPLHISAILAEEKRLWLGTVGSGVFILEKSTGELRPLFPPGSDLFKKLSKTRRIFRDSRRNIWLGTDEGLLCLSPDENVLEKFLPVNTHGEALRSRKVMDVDETPDGKIWVATYGGLHRFDPSAPPGKRMSVFLNPEIDLANYINDLLIAQNDDFWLATEAYFTVFQPATGTFVNYTTRDGLFIRQRMLTQLPSGKFVSGANAGFLSFNPDNFRPAAPPSIYWRDFRVFDRPAAQAKGLNTLPELVLRPGENHFSFEFGAINFEENARNSFAYQLEGYDRDWVPSGDRTFASYTNLPPGKYRFQVKAANRHGIWSAPRSIGVQILPPFYRTWWFGLLALVGLALVVWQAIRAWNERQWTLEAQRIIDYFANSTYSGGSVDEILWDVCRNCISRLNFEDTVIYMLDRERNILVQKAAFGPKNPRDFEILNPIERRIGQGIVGSAAAAGKPILIGDTRLDPRYIPDLEPMLSEITVPIIHNGALIGILDSEHSRRNFFNARHLHILQSIANLCAAKIVKAEAEENVRRKEAQLLELDKRLAESELTALKAQMNPHFLFNCLNSINWYIVKNRPLEASRYLTKFSRLIRLILDNSKHPKIPLATEIETLRLYVEMESIRFEEKFEYEIAVDDTLDTDEVKIAPMILQPFVENAIWHGLMPLAGSRPGRLRVEIAQRADHLHCAIEDNGIGREAAQKLHSGAVGSRESRGMRITAERIAILNQQGSSDGDFVQIIDLQGENGAAAGTRVELRLPLEM